MTGLKTAKNYFYQKDYINAYKLFSKEKEYYSMGLCCLLLKKEKGARICWKKNCFSSNASMWGLKILDLIHLKQPNTLPSFFQTRAFLEIYINLFIENDLIEWAENLISLCDLLYQCNPESYKFISRALFANGYFDLAITFSKKSLNVCYGDPEALLILSECYFLLGDMGEALDYVNKIKYMVDDYYPALLFEKIVRDEISKKKLS